MINLPTDYTVYLPDKKLEIPSPSASPDTAGFKLRGIKGWGWDTEQYLKEIPFLAKYKMNFLMNCYLSFDDVKNSEWHKLFADNDKRLQNCNNWWKPIPAEKKKSFEEIVKKCKENGINFCFSMNPNLFSAHCIKYNSDTDFVNLCKHFDWMQSLGVKWFNISLDDIQQEIDAKGQAKLVNKLLEHLRRKDKNAEMIFTPTHYTGLCDNDEYTKALSKELNKDVYIFWVGMDVPSPYIKTTDAQHYKNNIKHRIIIWENYPVNDANLTMHLGPLIKRDIDLYKVCEGFMGNSMCTESEIQRIPLITIADYAYNPRLYNPDVSEGQAILNLTDNKKEQQVLKELVELYPGSLRFAKPTNYNNLIEKFISLLKIPYNKDKAKIYLRTFSDFEKRFNNTFPNSYRDAAAIIKQNRELMEDYLQKTKK